MASNEKRAQELADLFGRDIDLGDRSSASYDDTRRITRQRRNRLTEEGGLIAYAAVYKRGTKLYLGGVSTKLIEIVDLKVGNNDPEVLDEAQVLIEDDVVYILVKTTASTREEVDTTATFDPFPTDGSLSFPNNNQDTNFINDFELYLPLKNKVLNKYKVKKVVLYKYFGRFVKKLEERTFEDSTVFDNSQVYSRSYQVNYWPPYDSAGWTSGFKPYPDWTGIEYFRAYQIISIIGTPLQRYGLVARISFKQQTGLFIGLKDAETYEEMRKICIISRARYNQGETFHQRLLRADEVSNPQDYPPGAFDPLTLPVGQFTYFNDQPTDIIEPEEGALGDWPLYRLIGNKSNPSSPGVVLAQSRSVFKDLSAIKYGEYVRYSWDNLTWGQSSRHPNFSSSDYFRPVVRFTEPATGRKYLIFGKSKFTITENKAWISEKTEIVQGNSVKKKIIAVGKFEYEQINDHGDAPVTPALGLDAPPVQSATGFQVKSQQKILPTTGWPGDISRVISDPFAVEWHQYDNVDGARYLNDLYFRSGFHHTSPSEAPKTTIYSNEGLYDTSFNDYKYHNSKAKITYSSDFGDNFSSTYSLDEPISKRRVFIPGHISEDVVLPAIGFMVFPTFKSDTEFFRYRSASQSSFTTEAEDQILNRSSISEKIGLDPTYKGVYMTRVLLPDPNSPTYQFVNPGLNQSILQSNQETFFGVGQPIKTMQQVYDSVFLPLSVARTLEHPDLPLGNAQTLRALILPIFKEKITGKILGLFFQEIHCLPKKKIFFTPGSVSYKDRVYSNDLDSMAKYIAKSEDYIISESEPILLGQFYNNRYSTQQKLIKNPYEPSPKETDFISYFYLTAGGMRPSSYLLDNRERIQRKQYIEFDRFVRDNKVPIPVSLPDGTKIADTFTPPTLTKPSETDISLVADAYNLDATINLVMPIVPPDDP